MHQSLRSTPAIHDADQRMSLEAGRLRDFEPCAVLSNAARGTS